MDTIERMLQRGQEVQGGGVTQALLSAPEAERIISQLAPLSIEEVGSTKWHTQHEWIERLNLQAHYNAQTHSDEFVVELLVSLDKLHVLIHDLLVTEAWKAHVYPLLSAHLAEAVDSVTAYLLLYHEVTVANLLQVALFHSHAAESLSEDYALEVADWCYRKLTALNMEGQKLAEHRDRSAEELMRLSRLEEQEEKRLEVEFSGMMCSLAILRYLTDALPRLPMGALSRVVSTNDTLMALLPLLDKPPWVRNRMVPVGGGGKGAAGGGGGGKEKAAMRPVLEKWVGNRWTVVAPADRMKITQTDGQVWLAVTNLLVEPRCRAKYGMDEYRRERILGLRRYLNELMFDQLPVLKDLQRVLNELALGIIPDQGAAGRSSALILEAVPVIRDALLRGRNWRAVAAAAKREHFGSSSAVLARERLEAMVKHLDFLCDLEPEPAGGKGAAAGTAGAPTAAEGQPLPPVKISTWRKVHDNGVYESWFEFEMEVDDTRPPEPVEVAAAGPSGKTAGSSSGSSNGVAALHGLRYRLQPLDVEATRPLPANGKAVVRWGSLTAEALLQLPELPTRSSEEGAAVLWVTVGLLAVDGVVLQVKLKKAPKPKERDRVAGVWYAYHPVAGALTVLREEAPQQQPQQQQRRDAVKATSGEATVPTTTALSGKGNKAITGAASSATARPLVQVVPEPAAAPRMVHATHESPSTLVGATGRGDVSVGAGVGSAAHAHQQPAAVEVGAGSGTGAAGAGAALGQKDPPATVVDTEGRKGSGDNGGTKDAAPAAQAAAATTASATSSAGVQPAEQPAVPPASVPAVIAETKVEETPSALTRAVPAATSGKAPQDTLTAGAVSAASPWHPAPAGAAVVIAPLLGVAAAAAAVSAAIGSTGAVMTGLRTVGVDKLQEDGPGLDDPE